MASTDLITRVTSGSRPLSTTLTAAHISGTFTAVCGALTGWPTNPAGVHFAIYKKDTSGVKVANSQTDWEGVVSSTSLISLVLKAGTDNGYSIGDTVEAMPTAAWADGLAQGLLTEHNPSGTHSAITATSLTASTITEGAATLQAMRAELGFDYVASGCVITADSVAVNKNYSMTAGVVYISGKRIVVSAVAAQTVTASNDRYVDVDSTGTLTTTSKEVANNAASPTLAASSLRLGIVVAGATTIATTASINQGQEDRVLPIASSILYAVTDSLGNLICSRDPQRKTLGQRQIVTSQSGITTTTDVIGLNATVMVPTGRKIQATLFGQGFQGSATGSATLSLLEDGVVIAQELAYIGTATGQVPIVVISPARTPTAGTHTYKVQAAINAGTGTFTAAATIPGVMTIGLA